VANETLKIDSNFKPTAGAITDNAAQEIRNLRIDDTTKGLKVMLVGGSGSGTVTSVSQGTGILLTPSPITSTGSVALATSLQPLATLAGNSLKVLRVNAAETAVEYVSQSSSAGTVTSVSVVSNAGVSGSVATATTTPAITLTLGNITPSAIQVSSLTASQILSTDGSKNLTSLDTATYPSLTELTYVKGVTSSIQTQLGTKVTAIGVTTANGVSGSSSGGTTPNLTITLGAITPTTVNGNTFTTGTYTLTGTAGKTLNFTNTLTLSGTDSTTMTFPTTSATIARTDAANTFTGVQTFSTPIATGSVAAMTATVGGGVPTPPNNTTTFLRGDGTFAAPTLGFTPSITMTTVFETSTRFTTNGGSGTATFDGHGLQLNTTATGTRYVRTRMVVGNASAGGANFEPYNNSPSFNCSLGIGTLPTTGESYFGIGSMTGNGTAMVYTQNHIGFKILIVAGVASVYGTQGDGTETATSALTTLNAGDCLDLSLKVNGSSSVDYYWSKNGSTWSSATNLTTHIPTTTTTDDTPMEFIVANKATANDVEVTISSASYSR